MLYNSITVLLCSIPLTIHKVIMSKCRVYHTECLNNIVMCLLCKNGCSCNRDVLSICLRLNNLLLSSIQCKYPVTQKTVRLNG